MTLQDSIRNKMSYAQNNTSQFYNPFDYLVFALLFILMSTSKRSAMTSPTIDDLDDGVSRIISETPPTHYTVKFQQFSLMAENKIERYESSEFEAGGYKWKLIVHPNGNKNKGVVGYLSAYLVMVQVSDLPPGWEVFANFRIFLLDQNTDNYLKLEDAAGKERRFHRMKLEWGFDQFVPLKAFNDASSGYLVDDTCIFGAEVFVCKERSKGKAECLSMMKNHITYKHTWKIDNYWKITAMCQDSSIFNAGNHKWKMQLYPNGKGNGMGSHLSLYVGLAETSTLPPATKIYAEFTLRILDQVNARHLSAKAHHWFTALDHECGWSRYIPLSYLYQANTGVVYKDSCCVEAEIIIIGVANALG